MQIPSNSDDAIDEAFRCITSFKEIRLDPNIMDFLQNARALLKAKATLNPQGPFKISLLHYAAMGNCTELLCLLLRNGARVDDRDQNKRTPLSWATEHGAMSAVKILLQEGAKINSTDDMFMTPLAWLLQGSRIPRVDMEVYLRRMGAREKGEKRRWILRRLR